MTTAAEQIYEKRIKFYAERLKTCNYRFYDMVQTRTKEISRLGNAYQDEGLQQAVEEKVLGSANVFINCLHGEHYSKDIPDYLEPEANRFKSLLFTSLAPKYILEEERSGLLERIFNQREGL